MNGNTYTRHSTDTKHRKAAQFLIQLVEAGIPVENLMTNDWDNCPSAKVYIETPYPNRKTLEYKRFSGREVTNAIRFYNLNK